MWQEILIAVRKIILFIMLKHVFAPWKSQFLGFIFLNFFNNLFYLLYLL